MPIYEYQCKECGKTSEFLTGLGQDETIFCRNCGSFAMEKIMSVPSFSGASMEQRIPGRTCCGREERCEKPPCSDGGSCRRG